MAELLSYINRILLIILAIVVIVVALAGLAIFYFIKLRKKNSAEKNIDYSDFNRRDVKDYIKLIDDIKEDMIILEDGTRYVGVIECQGLDFYSAHVVEKSQIVEGYLGFINTISKPITYRQYSASVDLEHTLNRYEEAYKKICTKLEKAQERLKEMNKVLKDTPDMQESRKKLYISEIENTRREISALNFRKFHIEDEIRYINENNGVAAAPLVTSTYVFDWFYNPNQFSVELTDEEILKRAKNELNAMANAKIHALSQAGVKAKRCTTNELIDMCRRHSQPISAERYKLRDVLRSSYFDDITTSDCLEQVKKDVRETLSNENAIEIEKEFRDFEKYIQSENKSNENDKIFITSGK